MKISSRFPLVKPCNISILLERGAPFLKNFKRPQRKLNDYCTTTTYFAKCQLFSTFFVVKYKTCFPIENHLYFLVWIDQKLVLYWPRYRCYSSFCRFLQTAISSEKSAISEKTIAEKSFEIREHECYQNLQNTVLNASLVAPLSFINVSSSNFSWGARCASVCSIWLPLALPIIVFSVIDSAEHPLRLFIPFMGHNGSS